MLRRLHSLPGLLAGLLLLILATSGAVLSLSPALERVAATVPARGDANVAQVADRVLQAYPGADQIERLPSGAVLVYFSVDGSPGADLVDPLTGTRLAPYEPVPFFVWMKDLHRAFLLDDPGRATAGVGAGLMVLMCLSGAFLLASRTGGWRKLLAPIRGSGSQRLHTELARAAVLALMISALSGAWMSAIRFEWLTEAEELEAEFPAQVAGTPPAPIGSLQALQSVDLRDLHQLIMPFPDDPLDVYSLRTHQGSGYVDQATGQWLAYSDYGRAAAVQTFIMELHTGEASWWVGLLLGLGALTVPVLAVTGVVIWWQRRRAKPRLSGNVGAGVADTLLLVGSETNTTWGFAKTLFEGLQAAGCQVHVAPLNQWRGRYPKARRLLILTSTYGDGDAPASASQFLHRLATVPGTNPLPWAVLGFGDRQFDNFCAFADQIAVALEARQWPRILATDYVDRQSAQSFERWCTALGTAIAMPLDLHYTPMRHATRPFLLAEREDYGSAVNAPTSILRFKAAPPHRSMPSFVAGDLVGIRAAWLRHSALLLPRQREQGRGSGNLCEAPGTRRVLDLPLRYGHWRLRRRLHPEESALPASQWQGARHPDRRRHWHRPAGRLHSRQQVATPHASFLGRASRRIRLPLRTPIAGMAGRPAPERAAYGFFTLSSARLCAGHVEGGKRAGSCPANQSRANPGVRGAAHGGGRCPGA